MQHQIPIAELGRDGERMARAVSTCVHCGFCLPACPTYKVLGEEMDSPRGRIVLMKQALEGDLATADALPFIDKCLGCLACETACPSGVRYRDLVVPFRARAEREARSTTRRASRGALLSLLESPAWFRASIAAGRIGQTMAPLLPRKLRDVLQLLPRELPPAKSLPAHTQARGARRARVALLAGCVQRVLRPAINVATLRVLAANGIEVIVPRNQGCCGALAAHSGHQAHGAALAAHNERVFPPDVDAIVTNAAGCGSAMKEHSYRVPVKDVSELLHEIGLRTAHAFHTATIIAYHDACHLSHGQGVRTAPRRLLSQIANATVAELHDGEMCCGSAGLYNLEQPEIAAELGRRKARAIAATNASLVAAGNIGCLTQIEAYLTIPARHTIEILDATLVATNE